ncbi:MAG: ATP-binding protein [Sulfuritalea sp.]|nr:ATP-binding protein [Sulfuritalea sp.]
MLASIGILLMVWLFSSWLVADSILKSRTHQLIQSETAALDKVVTNAARIIDLSLDRLHGISAVVAADEKVLAALSRPGTASPASMKAVQRGMLRPRDSMLTRVDAYLDHMGSSLGADALWIANASGDCIASSNSHRPESFVGANFADSDYFRMARTGKFGREYAIERMTNIPGLYFSAPITIDGRFAGVAATKIDLPKLSYWISQTEAFISDAHGVIILAHDPNLEMRSLADADIARMSASERMARYQRTDFPTLEIPPWKDQRFPFLRHFDRESQPVLISSRHLANEALEVHAYKRLSVASDFERERLNLFLSIVMNSLLVMSVIAGLVFFVRMRRQSEISTAQHASLLRATIESTADGILVVDSERRVTTCNRRFAEIWHIPPELIASGHDEEMMSHVLDQLKYPQAFAGRVLELYAHPELPSFDTLSFKDDKEIERYSFPQRLGDQVVGRVWSFRDVTERKRAEKALLDSHEELEIKVQERTADLQAVNLALLTEKARQEELNQQLAGAQHQLLQAEKMASIGQLAAGVAHEVTNPLTIIRFGTDFLARQIRPNSDQAAVLQDVRDAVGRADRIVKELLDFARSKTMVRKCVDLNNVVENALRLARHELDLRKVEVVRELQLPLPLMIGDPDRLTQVFVILIINAAQAIGHDGRIVVATRPTNFGASDLRGDATNSFRIGDPVVMAEVRDNGPGLSKDAENSLFNFFFTTKPMGEGTGLGLCVALNIVLMHNGTLALRNNPEGGASAILTFMQSMEQIDETNSGG